MKIIGKTEDGFIIEASKEDVAGIQGLYKYEKNMEIGTEIDFDGLFHKYANVSTALNDISKLTYTAELIMNAADWIKQFRSEK